MMADAHTSTEERRRAVAKYIERGAVVIPVPAGRKKPIHDGWQDLRLTLEDISHYWTDGQNIGLLTGEPSRWRVDADLDVEEAVRIAGRFLPPTLTSGRKSRPHSHWWYTAPGAESRDWTDIDGKRLIELRSTGRQTLVAPSTHPSGEEYIWYSESGLEMAKISAAELEARLRELATATLVVRRLPEIKMRIPARVEVATTTRWRLPAFCFVLVA
jgi:hypothetical protein